MLDSSKYRSRKENCPVETLSNRRGLTAAGTEGALKQRSENPRLAVQVLSWAHKQLAA